MILKKHKIVLYNPKTVFFDMPLALMAIGSGYEKDKFEVVIIDGRIEKDAHEKVLKECIGAVCFGVTVLTGSPIKDALEITRKVKKHVPQLPTIWGGWHPSLFPKEILLEEPSVDITVQGQGEVTFRELIDAFIHQSTLENIAGICFRNKEGEVVENTARKMENMEDLPPVDYNLIDVEHYFVKKGKKQLDYISSIGCLNRCAFCADPFVFKRKFSAISAERVASELKSLHQKYAFTQVNFQDETFFTYKERAVNLGKELCKLNLNIQWTTTLRADQGDRLTLDEFKLLAQSGLKRVLVGVESGSEEMMKRLGKDITKKQVLATANKCIKSGITVQFPFIVGLPDETDFDFASTLDFAIELRNMSDTFEIVIFYFKPYPGSDLANQLIKNGHKMPSTLDDFSKFDFIDATNNWLSKSKIRKTEAIKFYLKLSRNKIKLVYPLKVLAKIRLKHQAFNFPIEKWLIENVRPTKKLS